jgi:cyclin-dependent kinase 12/13
MAYMHDRGFIHRDIKGGNLLLNKQGILKIADFGLARILQPPNMNAFYTNKVVTLWYRAPEILLGMANYGPAIDIWSIGCFFTELLTGKPLLPGRDEAQQIQFIFDKCGTPSERDWPGLEQLKYYETYCRSLRLNPS